MFGGKMDDDYQKKVNKAYPGRYGSLAFGVYNGGGYHALENNKNKIIDGRLSIRPLPDIVPGLQFNAAGLLGKGNSEIAPDFSFGACALTYESESIIFVGQYYSGKGDQKGKTIDSLGNSYSQNGYSVFGEFKIPITKFSIWGRYDNFVRDIGTNDFKSDRYIAGVSYYFVNGSKLLIDLDSFNESNSSFKKDLVFEFAVEVKF